MARSVASFVIDKLKDPVLQEAFLLCNISGKVNSVTKKLEYIKAALEDAEKRGKEDKAARVWVDQVREVAFRIEDAIDIYHIDVKGDGTSAAHGGGRSFNFVKRVQKNLKRLAARHNLGVELSDIEATLKEIKENKDMFKSDESVPSESSHLEEKLVRRKRQFEFLDESQIVGLEDDKKAIVKKLLDAKVPDVITIVGTGGLGKTTLAQKVFNSTEVKEKFNVQIWLSISREFDTVSILKKMLEKIREIRQEEKGRDEEYFIKEIRNSLKKQRFLIVLDDVWDEQFWPDIKQVCPSNDEMAAERGRVLITTRDLNVALTAQSEPYSPPFLKLEDSKTLLYKCAFPKQEPPRGFDDVATKIANKCAGLPLALIVVGGQLYNKDKHSEWRKVADSMNWHEGKGLECIKVLESSYDDMQIILRTCFMYLASFPEDYTIIAKHLIRTWVAENIVPDEETGDSCLQQLAQRCLIIVRKTSYDGSIEAFGVHDLVLELAVSKAKENKFVSVLVGNEKQMRDEQVVCLNNARRASLQSVMISSQQSIGRKYNKKLRSLLVFRCKSLDFDLSWFRLLAVLQVDNIALVISYRQFEKWCEELVHLRHLEVRSCIIENKKIPESIGRLKNMLTLDCYGTVIDDVPDSLWSITTLRHVRLITTNNLDPNVHASKQKTIITMPNLKTLGDVFFKPSKMYHFSQLHSLVFNYNGPWIVDGLLKNLNNNLVHLEIRVPAGDIHLDGAVLDMRNFPFYQNLQSLILNGFWPKHVGLRSHLFPPHLIQLILGSYTLKEDPMPELEQLQKLEILELGFVWGMNERITILTSSTRGFPQLQTLKLGYFPNLEKFSIAPGAMSMLQELKMKGFPRLRNNIPELQHLKMLRCFEWTDAPFSYEKEIQAMREKNQHKLQHIPIVVINNRDI